MPAAPPAVGACTVKRGVAIGIAVLLAGGILTAWVDPLWATAAFEAGAFLLAMVWIARQLMRPQPMRFTPTLAIFAAAAFWAAVQLCAGLTAYPWATRNALLLALQRGVSSRPSRGMALTWS